ncbi:MAG TPA: beta-Ala-His dipeptidase [Patescibacteria group bacterium]|nr:beta-Ala-His dipeptidase [Patescibacteria group bacterium]
MSGTLEGLEPRAVWEIFEEISRIPRCSKREQELGRWIKDWAEENGVSFKQDEVGNILLAREAAEGHEGTQTLVLQCHQDMVCEKTEGSPHDFAKDPIPLRVDGDLLRAEGTSLGADNGVGMAIAMAVMVEPRLLVHGRLEAVLTVDEETGLTGAVKMQLGFFTGKRMINLDSEELGVIIISSAGGGGTNYSYPEPPTAAEGWGGLRLNVGGLLGGHSGVDIHLPRMSANKLLGEGLKVVLEEMPIRIAHIEGGTRGNAIARSAHCVFLVPPGRAVEAQVTLKGWGEGLDRFVEKEATVRVSEVDVGRAFSEDVSRRVVGLINDVPQGPYSWSDEFPDLVQTSNNLGVLRTEGDVIRILLSTRSSDKGGLDENQGKLKELGRRYGAETQQRAGGTGWKADPESPFLALVTRCYEEVLGRRPEVTGIHGGLECGVLSRFDPDLMIVSIGPDISYPHSPQELVRIGSVGPLWETVKRVVEELVNE